MRISEVMNKNIRIVRPDSGVVEVARQMRDGDFGVMPVCENDKLQGMVTDRDIAIRAVAEGKDINECQVSDVMTGSVVTCFEDDDVESVAQIMADRQIHRLPVLDRNNKLCGIVSVGDLALVKQEQAGEALSGISEKRHDEPGQSIRH